MDSVLTLDEGDMSEREELEVNERYTLHRYFLNYLRAFKRQP